MRWEDARTAAQKAGGKLVVVSDAEEAFWLKSLVVKNACEDALWTGGRYANNQWTWATKEEWNPTGWFVNTDTHNSREVLLLDPIHGWMAKAPDNTPRGFVIEWSDDPVDHITAPPIAQELPSPPPLHRKPRHRREQAACPPSHQAPPCHKKFSRWNPAPSN